MAGDRKRMDLNNFNVKLIVAGMAGLIDEGNTPHDVFDILEDIKNNTFHALADMRQENLKEGK